MAVNNAAATESHPVPSEAIPPPMVVVRAHIPAAHADALVANAERHDRTPAAELRRAVRFYLRSLGQH